MAVGGMAGAVGALISGSDPFASFGIGAAVAAVAYRFNAEEHPEIEEDYEKIRSQVGWIVGNSGLLELPEIGYEAGQILYYAETTIWGGRIAGGVIGRITNTRFADWFRMGRTIVSNQIVIGPGARGSVFVNAIKGGGGNLPFHYHIHQYNWYKPWIWFKYTPILRLR
jgi:hypothetical protein